MCHQTTVLRGLRIKISVPVLCAQMPGISYTIGLEPIAFASGIGQLFVLNISIYSNLVNLTKNTREGLSYEAYRRHASLASHAVGVGSGVAPVSLTRAFLPSVPPDSR